MGCWAGSRALTSTANLVGGPPAGLYRGSAGELCSDGAHVRGWGRFDFRKARRPDPSGVAYAILRGNPAGSYP